MPVFTDSQHERVDCTNSICIAACVWTYHEIGSLGR
jgi:hypothetical protein